MWYNVIFAVLQAEPYFLSTSRCPTWTTRTRPLSGSGRRERDFSSDDFYEDSVPIAMSTLRKGQSQFSARVPSSLTRKILLLTVQVGITRLNANDTGKALTLNGEQSFAVFLVNFGLS